MTVLKKRRAANRPAIISLIMHRRSFLAAPLAAYQARAAASTEERIYAYGDGIPLEPDEYARVLSNAATAGVEADDYSRGGIVGKLEERMAALLGKEVAAWMPTGTLANHMAVRLLAGSRRRVLVQADSHLFNDCGDCAQTLSGLHLVPLAPGKATFTIEHVDEAATDAMNGRVPAPVGAVQIETPVRRLLGERFDFETMKRVAAWARERGVGMHLDGARLFIESAYTRRPVREVAALFDTVYISMYKYFNAASGAVLAGPRALLGNLHDTRRMFGGGLHQVWPFAAVALHYIDGFEPRLAAGVKSSEMVLAALAKDGNFEIRRVPNGTNVFQMRVFNVNPPVYRNRLEAVGISARVPVGEWITMQVNETWAHVAPDAILSRFRKALG